MTRRSYQTPKLPLILWSFFSTLCLFFAIEAISRIVWDRLASRQVPYEFANRFDSEPELFQTIYDKNGEAYLYATFFPTKYLRDDNDLSGRVMRAKKAADTIRVFSFGESATAGSPWGHWASYTTLLETLLKKMAKPGVSIEVINFGVRGYGSSRIARLVQRTLEYNPDVILLYAGHNEYCELAESVLQPVLGPKDPWTTLATFLFRNLAVVRLAHFELALYPQIPKEPLAQPTCTADLVLNSESKEILGDIYRRNISDIVQSAASRHIPVVLGPQISSYVHPPAAVGSTPEITKLADELSHSLPPEDQAQKLFVLAQLDPQNPMLEFYRGIDSLEHGDTQAALQDLQRSIDLDQKPLRFGPSQRQILEQIAQSSSNVTFIDFEKHVQQYLPDGVIDGRLLVDRVHPNLTGHRILAEALLQDFFISTHFKSQLLNYSKYNAQSVWNEEVDLERYSKAWSVFYSKAWKRFYGKPLPEEMLIAMKSELLGAQSLFEKHYKWRLWEPLYYLGQFYSDDNATQLGAQVFQPPNISQTHD